jgi:hypothetical protein
LRVVFLFFLSLLFLSSLFASEDEWEELIIKKMIMGVAQSKVVTLYTKDATLQKEFKRNSLIHMTDDCKKSDFVLIRDSSFLKTCKKPAIVFDYYSYLHNPNAIGVFFWQKGRPTIRFSKKRLEHFGLQLNGELSKFVSSKD